MLQVSFVQFIPCLHKKTKIDKEIHIEHLILDTKHISMTTCIILITLYDLRVNVNTHINFPNL